MDSSISKRRKLDHAGTVTASIDVGVHRHHTFVLESQELLNEVRVNYKETFPDADDVLRRVKQAVEAIEPHDPLPVGDAITQFEESHKIAIPFPHPKPSISSNYKFSLRKPSKVNVVGSYILQTMVQNPGLNCVIDLVVVMPETLFQDKDYLNMRYFYKRAYFLAHLAAAVQEEFGDQMEIEVEHFDDNELLPVLVVQYNGSWKPSDKDKPVRKDKKDKREKREKANEKEKTKNVGKTSIRIIPCAPGDLFPKKKILPTSNGIRPTSKDSNMDDLPATPFYNSTLIAEMSYIGYLRLLHHTTEQCPAFADACILARIWLRQRGIGTKLSQGGFGHFEFAAVAALLLRPGSGKKGQAALSSSLGSTQIFKAVLRFLSTTDFANKPRVFGSIKQIPGAVPTEGPTLFDSERGHNVAYKMSPWSVALLRQHAKWSSTLFADERSDQFNPMFIVKADLLRQMYDLVVTIPGGYIEPLESADKKGNVWNSEDRLYTILKAALGGRAQLIHIESATHLGWKLPSHTPRQTLGDIRVGIVFDSSNMSRKMDRGPDAEDRASAAKFRQFWGERSELRRFQDGSMTENVIWTQATPFGICEEIVGYILQLHLHINPDDLDFTGAALPSLINASVADTPAFIATRTHFEELEKDIRKLDKLPLYVRLVSPIAPELRYSSLQLPPSTYNKDPTRPLDVVISFETSSKWPDNLVAIQRTKIALLSRIGALLEEQKDTVKARIGLVDSPNEMENLAFLDVTYDNAITFRLNIHSGLEESMLERRTKDPLIDQKVKTESAELLAKLRKDCVTLPLHTQTILRFCTQFPALSPTIRLLKYWFSRHKLTVHFSDELIELLAANIFLQPYPWQAPASASTGFLRTLQYLARWDWRNEPLVVDFSGEMTTAETGVIDTRLEAWRKIDPNMNRTVLFVATNTDATGTAYTHSGPGKVVAARMTALAKGVCKVVRSASQSQPLDLETLFKPNTKEFDFVIRLSAKSLRSVVTGMDKKNKFKNLAGTERTSIPKPPANMFLDVLNNIYGDSILFFQGDNQDAGVILGVWNQQIRARSFRVNLPCSFKPVEKSSGADDDDDDDNGELVEVNRASILSEIARIGGEIVDKIEVNGEV